MNNEQNRLPVKVVAIIGAGPAGLTAALELLEHDGYSPIVLETDDLPGGISRTVNFRGNRIDIGGHRFFSKSDWVMQWWLKVLPLASDQVSRNIEIRYQNQSHSFNTESVKPSDPDEIMLLRPRLSRIFFNRNFFNYPITLSIETLSNLGLFRSFRIGMSYLNAVIFKRRENSLEDFLINRFGRELYLTFFKSYTEKVWGVSCTQISSEWGAQRIKGLSIAKAILHIIRKPFLGKSIEDQKKNQTSLIERFMYPKHGPGQMWETVAKLVRAKGGQVRYKQQVIGVTMNDNQVASLRVLDLSSGVVSEFVADFFISTMPVKDLVAGMQPHPPESIRQLALTLPYRDFITVGLLVSEMCPNAGSRAVSANNMPPDNWIYIQEPDVKLGRLQIFNNWSLSMVRDPGTIWLGLEYFCNEGDFLWNLSDDEMKLLAIRELVKIGMINEEACMDAVVIRMPKAYPAYFGSYEKFDQIKKYIDNISNLFLIGRNGMHRYNNQDHSMLTAREAVRCIVTGQTDKSSIWNINLDQDYHEEKTS